MTAGALVVRGFYAVLDRDDESLARRLVIEGRARVLQLRIKPRGGEAPCVRDLLEIGAMAQRVCREAGAAFVVNDRLDVALALGADAVHLGQADLPIGEARALARGALAIGVSTHDVAQVRAAVAAGADYVGFGPVFTTTTKANPDPIQGLDGLREAVAAAGRTPVVAIGGVTAAHAAELYSAGAAAICAISAVNEAADVGLVARLLGA